jgi:putative DNA primase/helicase
MNGNDRGYDQWASSRAEFDGDRNNKTREHNPIVPPPYAPDPNFSHPIFGQPTAVWPYRTEAGELFSYVARYDPPNDRKQFVPYTYHVKDGWRRKAPPTPRLLFGLDKLKARPSDPILIVEGEKAAVGLDGHGGAAALLPSHVCITSLGGAQSPEYTDWLPVADRDVVIWPDADEAGADYATVVARLALDAGARSVRIVDVSDLPDGFDLGDDISPDLDIVGRIQNAVESGRYISFGPFTMDPVRGLSVEIEKDGKVETHFVSGAFKVLGRVRTPDGEQWARLLRWCDEDKRVHTMAIPDAELHGDAKALAALLATRGLKVSTGKGRPHLAHYLNSVRCDRRLTLVDRTGWHEIDGQRVFVLPGRTIGLIANSVVFNSRQESPYDTRGTLEDWQDGVGRLVCDHTRPTFAVSAALAAPMLRIVDQEGGGFHFHGDSSTGKSAAAAAAASVWGRGSLPGFMDTWRATANAIEGTAAAHNDTPLVLDEIGLVDAREAAASAYQLAAGVGKGRMARDRSMLPALTWSTMVLSTGEIRLADKLRENGQRPMAGQAIRLADIPADAGRSFGAFDHPGPTGNAKDLADEVKLAARTHYGTAGLAFLERALKAGLDEVREALSAAIAKFRAEHVSTGADGQVQRAADRFGLVAASGELACEFGIVPWPRGSAYTAASVCFRAWLDRRGGMEPSEVRDMIAHVRYFVEAHGESRFVALDVDSLNPRPVINRAGFRQGSGETEEWWCLPETWKGEVCAGLDPTQTARVLADREMLIPGTDSFAAVRRVEGRPLRVYVLTSKILAGEAKE